ncbi:MAG: hydroxyacid dehydrogenase [Rhodospirillaceae bacterium]|nr:hydroxyacid dehydrogenase [Rhodospirillaceae bacterium]
MPHVLVLGRIHEAGTRVLAEGGASWELLPEPSPEETLAKAPAADAILIRTSPLPAAAIEAAPRLRIVSRHGVGYDNIDVAACTRRRIPVTVVGDVNSVPVAEHTMMLMLALARRAVAHDRSTREGAWAVRDRFAMTELAGKRLLLLGFGRIGREVARRARAFDMAVHVYDPYVREGDVSALGCRREPDLDAALPHADFVSVHMPLTPETRNMLDGAALARLKPSASVICTARGGIVDEAALAAALAAGRLRGAGLDVFAREPPPGDLALLGLDNVVLSPHCAALTEECAIRMATISARNCLDGLAGRLRPELVVNRTVLG